MKAKTIKLLGCLIAILILYGVCKKPSSASFDEDMPESSRTFYPSETVACETPIHREKAKPLQRKENPMPPHAEYDLWNRPNMTMDGEEGINPWDAEQTEYDLMYEDPDLYDFIAD